MTIALVLNGNKGQFLCDSPTFDRAGSASAEIGELPRAVVPMSANKNAEVADVSQNSLICMSHDVSSSFERRCVVFVDPLSQTKKALVIVVRLVLCAVKEIFSETLNMVLRVLVPIQNAIQKEERHVIFRKDLLPTITGGYEQCFEQGFARGVLVVPVAIGVVAFGTACSLLFCRAIGTPQISRSFQVV